MLVVVATSTTAYSATPPAGYTNLTLQTTRPMLSVWYKFAQNTSESAPTLTNAGTTSVAVMLAYRLIDSQEVTGSIGSGTSTAPATVSITIDGDDDLVCSIYGVTSGTATTWTAPGSTNSRSNIAPTTTLTGILVVDEDVTTTTTTVRTATLGSSLAWQSIAISAASSGGPNQNVPDPWPWEQDDTGAEWSEIHSAYELWVNTSSIAKPLNNGEEGHYDWEAADWGAEWFEDGWALFDPVSVPSQRPLNNGEEGHYDWESPDTGAEWVEEGWALFDPVGASVNYCNGAVLLQHYESGFAAANPLYAALPTNALIGNVIICGITVRGTTDPGAPTPTDTVGGGTWILAVAPATSTGAEVERTAIWYMYDTTGSGHSASWTFTGSFKGRGFIQEWSGLAASSPFDTSTTVNVNYLASGASPVTIGPLAGLAQQNELAILQFGLYESNGTAPDSGLRTPAGWAPQFLDTNTNNYDGIVYCFVPNVNAFSTPSATFSWTQIGTDAAQALLTTWKLNSPCPLKPDEWDWDSDNQNEIDWLEAEWDLFEPLVHATVPSQQPQETEWIDDDAWDDWWHWLDDFSEEAVYPNPPEDAWDWSYEEPEEDSFEYATRFRPNIELVQTVVTQVATNSTATATLNNVSQGNFLAIQVASFSPVAFVTPTVTDSNANQVALVWAGVADPATNGNGSGIWYVANATAGTHTITASLPAVDTAGGYLTLVVTEWSGIAQVEPLDVYGYTVITPIVLGTTLTASTSNPTTYPVELVLAVIENADVSPVALTDPPAGFTSLFGQPDGTTYLVMEASYQITSGTGTPSATWSWTGAATVAEAAIAAFKIVPGTPITVPDEWDWSYEEVEDELWWRGYDDSATLAGFAIVNQLPEDVFPWDEEEPDESWWAHLDDFSEEAVYPQPAEDAWDWAYEEIEDEWTWAVDDSATIEPPVFIAIGPEDAWDWAYEEVEDELWWTWIEYEQGINAGTTLPYVIEDVYPWDEELEDEAWWTGLDDSATLQPPFVAPQSPEDAWGWEVDPEPDDEWWAGLDDYDVEQPFFPPQSPEDAWDWAPDDSDDDAPWLAWDDGTTVQNGTTLPYVIEDAWDWAPEDAAEDEAWWTGLDDYAVEQPFFPPAIPEDAWDWGYEEPEEDLTWQAIDDATTVQFVPIAALGPEDAWDWAYEELEDEGWWYGYDDFTVLQPPPNTAQFPEDAWDWGYEEVEDENWWHGFDDANIVQNNNVIPVAPPAGFDPKTMGRLREKLGVKWGAEEPKPEEPPKPAPKAKRAPKPAAKPSGLLLKILGSAGIGPLEVPPPRAPAPEEKKPAPLTIEPEKLPIAPAKVDKKPAPTPPEDPEKARLERREEKHLARIAKLEAEIARITERMAEVERATEADLDEARRIAAQHAAAARAAENETTRQIAQRVEEARLAEEELRRARNNLIAVQAAMNLYFQNEDDDDE